MNKPFVFVLSFFFNAASILFFMFFEDSPMHTIAQKLSKVAL